MIREAGCQEVCEETLLERAAKGDAAAFGEFFRIKRERVFRLAARITGASDADDVVQVVFIRLWKTLPVIRNLKAVNAWLTRTTVNRAIDTLRHVGRRLKIVSTDEMDFEDKASPSGPIPKGEMTKVFTKVSECLGERQKVAFILMEIEGFTSKETGKLMEIKSSTVRNLVMKAREKLRKEMTEMFPEYVPGKCSTQEVALNE